MSDLFALLQTQTVPVDLHEAAEGLGTALDHPPAEILQLLSARSGILMENLTRPLADRCAATLQHEGIATVVIPASAIVDPPEPLVLTSAILEERHLSLRSKTEQGMVPWSEFIWGDLISVQVSEEVQVEEWNIRRGAGGGRLQRHKVQNLATTWRQQLDLVSYDPWLLLRIDPGAFDWSSTGLVIHPTRRQNILALAIAIGSRCTEASFGRGMSWITQGGPPPTDHRAKSPQFYEQMLRWQLTLLFLDDQDEN